MDIQAECYDGMVAEFEPLLRRHYEEVESDKEHVPLELHHYLYRQTEAAGSLQITTARVAGKLVGYVFFVLTPHFHHASTPFGLMDLFYLEPEYRKGSNAIRLFRAAEKRLIEAGARKIQCGCKAEHSLEPLFRRLGYRPDELYFCKVV